MKQQLKELFKIFEKYTLEDVPSAVKEDMITTLNTEATKFNSFLIYSLTILNDVIEELEKGNTIIAASNVDYVLAFEFMAKNLVLVIEHKKEDLKINSSELDSILINAKSILNAVESIRKLQTEKLKDLTPEELLIALTT